MCSSEPAGGRERTVNALTGVLRGLMHSVRTINRKYAKPQIEMTPFVKICLLTLRLYLLLLIGLMVYKFVISIT
jgi:hypothetical protein